jgi:hypothetical protein
MEGYAFGAQVARDFGIFATPNAVRKRLERGIKAPALTTAAQSWSETADGATVSRVVSTQPRTLDELVEACEIDLTQWRVTSWTANAWAHQWQVKAKLAPLRVHGATPALLVSAYEQALASAVRAPAQPRLVPRRESGLMALVSLADHHFGKLGWAREVGESYDLTIAVQRWREAGEHLLARITPQAPDLIVLPIGNDLFHVDSNAPQTTAGTPQDTDTRYLKMVEAGLECVLWLARACAEIAPTRIVIVPGNHARQTETMLGLTLKHALAPNPNITVDGEPTTRKKFRWGGVLLGFTHGDEEKPDDLPLLMATEWPEEWALSHTREWILGHWHKNTGKLKRLFDSFNGVRVEIMPSLCGTDAWHYRKGYVGQHPEAMAVVYSKTRGRDAVYLYRADV